MAKNTKTLISFDLKAVLSNQEIRKFEREAKKAGAKSLTDHFLNITVRLPKQRTT